MTIRRHVFIHLVVALTVMTVVFASVSISGADPPERISVVYCKDCIPFEFQNQDSQPDGIIMYHWKLWSQKTGIKIEYKPAAWNQTLNMMRQGQADAHAGLFFSEERDKFLLYGEPLRKTSSHIFFHKQLPLPESNQDFKAYRIGVISGDFIQGYLKRHLPEATIKGYASYESMMEALRRGDIKVFAADTLTALYHLQKSNLANTFRYQSNMPLYQSDWFVAVREGDSDLVQLINKGMHQITDAEKQNIARQWASAQRTENTGALIIAIDRNYPPFSFIGPEGDPAGLSIELWQLWSKTTGTPVRFRPSSWAETLEALRNGEADIHFGLFKNKERSQWMDFSEPIHRIATCLYFDAQKGAPISLAKLKGQKVGAMRGSYQENYLKINYPDIIVVSQKDNEDLVLALLRGETKAIINEIPAIESELNRLLKPRALVRSKDILFGNFMYAGVLKGNSALLKKINDGFAAISYDQLAEMEARWIPKSKDRFYKKETDPSKLTLEEQNWLEQHRVIRIGNELDWPPFDFVEEGEPKGYTIDIVRLMAEELGIAVKFVNGFSWAELVEMFEQGKLDVLPAIYKTEERRKTMAFTKEYVGNPSILIVQENSTDIAEMADLVDRKVAAIEGYATTKALKERHPRIKQILVKNVLEGLEKVSLGEVDAFVADLGVVSYIMQYHYIPGVKIVGDSKVKTPMETKLHMAVLKDRKILRDLLQKGLDSITADEFQEIRKRWMPISVSFLKSDEQEIQLTRKEHNWLEQHKAIRLGIDPSWPPFEATSPDGTYIGIASDYIKMLKERLKIEMNPVRGLSWSEVLNKAKKYEIDVIPCIVPSPEREKFLLFTKPYMTLQTVIVTKEDAKFVDGLKDLEGQNVGVIQGYVTNEVIERDYPGIHLKVYSDIEEGLKAVANGDVVAFVDNLLSITFAIKHMGLENVKIASTTEYKFDLALGVRKDWVDLVPILEKGLDTISKSERSLIHDRWVNINIEKTVDWGYIWKVIFLVAVLASAIIIVIFIWNRRLAGEIRGRKQKEKLIKLGAQISQSLTVGDTLKKTLQSITDILVKELNVAFARIWIVDKTNDILKLEASSGLHTHIEGDHERLPIGGDTKIGRVVSEQKPHISSNIQDSRYVKNKDWARKQGLTSYAGIPMVVEGRSVGALVVFCRESLPEDTINTILSISDSIAVAIERSRAQDVALASEKKIRAMSDSSLDALIMIDGKANIIFWNPAAEKVFGYSAEEVMGRNLHELVVLPEDRDIALKGVETFAQTGEGPVIGVVIERSGLRKDGSMFPAEIAVSALQMDDAWFAVGTVRDITERKKAEDALKASEKRVQTILNSINTGVIIIDPENRTIVDVNPVAAQMIGLPREKIIGQICHQFICPKAVNDCPVIDNDQEIDNAERVLVTAAGKEVPILKTVTSVDIGGKTHLLESFIDITERKEAEEELQQHLQDLQKFERLAIGREERMIDLKTEINDLLKEMGQQAKYKIV